MPDFIDFPEANFTYAKPDNWDEKDCGSLRVRKDNTKLASGAIAPVVTSKWKFSKEEMETLLENGGEFYLHVFGVGQPPISMQVEYPFGNLKSGNMEEITT